jgi:alkylhydroperoxidase family enzyme
MNTRVAQLAQHQLTEDDYANVAQWATWPGYSPAERTAIEFAEKFAIDHMKLDDSWIKEAKQHYTDEQLHGMALMIGTWIALGRMQTVFDIHLSCALQL